MPNTLPKMPDLLVDNTKCLFSDRFAAGGAPSWIWGFIPSMLLFVFFEKSTDATTMLNSLTIALTKWKMR